MQILFIIFEMVFFALTMYIIYNADRSQPFEDLPTHMKIKIRITIMSIFLPIVVIPILSSNFILFGLILAIVLLYLIGDIALFNNFSLGLGSFLLGNIVVGLTILSQAKFKIPETWLIPSVVSLIIVIAIIKEVIRINKYKEVKEIALAGNVYFGLFCLLEILNGLFLQSAFVAFGIYHFFKSDIVVVEEQVLKLKNTYKHSYFFINAFLYYLGILMITIGLITKF